MTDTPARAVKRRPAMELRLLQRRADSSRTRTGSRARAREPMAALPSGLELAVVADLAPEQRVLEVASHDDGVAPEAAVDRVLHAVAAADQVVVALAVEEVP